jgi:Mg2+ and Co2+ transporter CorA
MTIKAYNDFKEFESEAEKLGVQEDLRALLTLDANFVERYRNYVLVNLKDYDREPNNLLVLSYETNLVFSGKQFTERDFSLFRFTVRKKYGESTVLALLALRKVLQNYTNSFEKLSEQIDKLEERPDIGQLQDVSRYLRKLTDRVEDFVDVLTKLEERRIREVNTQYVSYDWDLLNTQAQHLLDRGKRRLAHIQGIRQEQDTRSTLELNKRIEVLSDVVKRLTAITVLLMIPTLIATWWGMNFAQIPLASEPTGFWALVVGTIVLTLAGYGYLRRKRYV